MPTKRHVSESLRKAPAGREVNANPTGRAQNYTATIKAGSMRTIRAHAKPSKLVRASKLRVTNSPLVT